MRRQAMGEALRRVESRRVAWPVAAPSGSTPCKPTCSCETSAPQVECRGCAELTQATRMAEVVGFAFVSMAPRCLGRIYFHAAHEISDSTFLVLLHGTFLFLVF